MSKSIKVRDLTLCDEDEPLSLTRLPAEDVERLLPLYRDAHFHILELWRGILTDRETEREVAEAAWQRLHACDRELRGVSMLGVLSHVGVMLGDGSRPTMILDEKCRRAFASGLDLIRFSCDDNDPELLRRTTRKVCELGGLPDVAIRYMVDAETETVVEEEPKRGFLARLFPHSEPDHKEETKIFTDEYFVGCALDMERNGAGIITIADPEGLLTPSRLFSLMPKLKIALKVPVDIYVASVKPGVALASVLMAIIKGVDIIDTSIWGFGGAVGGPAIELVSIFCQKLDIELDIDMKAVGKVRAAMAETATTLVSADPMEKKNDSEEPCRIWTDGFSELYQAMPREIDLEFDRAIEAAGVNDEPALVDACRKIEAYFGFGCPDTANR